MNLIKLFEELVTIDSPSGNEEKIANYIFSYLKQLSLQPQKDSNNMIYCHINNNSTDEPKLICAHMDTVQPGCNINVINKKGYLQSDQKTILGGDNKASIAAILKSITELLKANLSFNIELLFTVREETNAGIRTFDNSKLKSSIGLVFDGGEKLNQVDITAPTIQDFTCIIKGKAAHASNPSAGKNALSTLLQSHTLPIGQVDPQTTFNIGLIKGGSATNTVPAEIQLEGDLRSLSHKEFIKNKKKIEKILNKSARKTGTNIDLNWIPYSYSYKIDENDSDLLNLIKTYKKLNIDLKYRNSTGGSDAGYLNHIGIKTFCLGYGVENPHTVEEKISIKNLHKLKEIIKHLTRTFS